MASNSEWKEDNLLENDLRKYVGHCFALFYYIFTHNTVITELAPQVAEANRGGPGKIKINEIF